VSSDENKTYCHNGGSAGTMADYTLLATPTDTVLSVNGATGAVTLTHDGFSDFVANEHLDWTADQGGTNIHAGNYTDTNTTYSVGDAGLTEKNFTAALNTKLAAIEASATADQTNAEIKTAYEANADTNEFSDAEQTKLSGVATSANNYTHPTGAGDKHIPTAGASGQFLKYSASGTAVWAADNNTTYSVGDAGLTEKNFTAALKTKLDGVATSANNYVHPTSAGNKHIPTGGATDQVLTYSASGTAVWAAAGGGGGVESGTKMMFYQASAPTDWTQDTTASLDGRALRVETGSGGGSGGSHDLASPPSISHSHSTPSHAHSHTLSAGSHTLSTAEMPSHSHSIGLHNSNTAAGQARGSGGAYGNGAGSAGSNGAGSSSSHQHSLSGSITSSVSGTSGTTSPTAFAPKYINVIICTKD